MNTNQREILTLDELARRYPRQWLAVTVEERDSQNGQPVRVALLAREIDVFLARRNAGAKTFCTMYTGPVPEVDHLGMF